jgi:hypothetical protein
MLKSEVLEGCTTCPKKNKKKGKAQWTPTLPLFIKEKLCHLSMPEKAPSGD